MTTNYSDFKREVASTLSKVLLGKTKRRHLRPEDKQRIDALMRELDKTFKDYGVDWKLDGKNLDDGLD